MVDDTSWIEPAVDKAKEASPDVTDAAADKLKTALAGPLQIQRLTNKQLGTTAEELLEAMGTPDPDKAGG